MKRIRRNRSREMPRRLELQPLLTLLISFPLIKPISGKRHCDTRTSSLYDMRKHLAPMGYSEPTDQPANASTKDRVTDEARSLGKLAFEIRQLGLSHHSHRYCG